MISAPSLSGAALLIGLSLFLGFAFEDFFAHSNIRRPGGIRTFPILASAGGVLYLFDPTHFLPFTAGLIVLGIWLAVFYRQHVGERDEEGEPNVGLVVPALNVHAYLLRPIALALPPWFAVGFTVIAVLLLTGREKLHALARRVDVDEVITAGEFLILTGIVLPLLPNEPVTTLTTITPRHAWLALVVVCSLSYASYLAQRYWAAAARGLWMAALGGLYSSTATTVVLARQARSDGAMRGNAQAGITLATAIMYLRILAIVAFFNWTLAWRLAPSLIGLSLAGLVICALQYRFAQRPAEAKAQETGQEIEQETGLRRTGGNPLELGPAALFAALFVAVSLVSNWAKTEFGTSGIYTLAAIVGVTDIDPFVLNLAQGGTTGMSNSALAAAILIAASSNNILKALYAAAFAGGRATIFSAAVLVLLAVAGVIIAMTIGGG
jgi:uncharacterized membrane protein (DUF4010 family)